MSMNAVNISARIPQEDAEFISQLIIEGAKTPSDKLRAIIAEARRRNEGAQNYRGSFQMMRQMLAPIVEKVRQMEMEQAMHSEYVSRSIDWLPDLVAFIITSGQMGEENPAQQLIKLEQGLAERVFGLMQSILQLGVTQRSPCYDPNVISHQAEPVLQIAELIHKQKRSSKEGENR